VFSLDPIVLVAFPSFILRKLEHHVRHCNELCPILLKSFILHLFYLSWQIVSTGYFFIIYCHLLFWHPCHIIPDELWEPSCKSNSLPVDRISKGQSRDNYIILLFSSKHKRLWIKVIFLQDKHNINAVLKYKVYVYSTQNTRKAL